MKGSAIPAQLSMSACANGEAVAQGRAYASCARCLSTWTEPLRRMRATVKVHDFMDQLVVITVCASQTWPQLIDCKSSVRRPNM